jgi:flagellar biosynthetic protein FlhB
MGLLFGLALLTLFIQGRRPSPGRVSAEMVEAVANCRLWPPVRRPGADRVRQDAAEVHRRHRPCARRDLAKAVGLDQLIGADPVAIGGVATELVVTMVKAVAILVAAIALFDFFYQRWSFTQRMKMTFQEVKDEHKQNEGDRTSRRSGARSRCSAPARG